MAKPLLLLADPGIDGAFAITLALADPDLDVVGIAAAAGNASAEDVTRNVHVLVEHIDPPKRPRLGEALPVRYEQDASHLHGVGGLGGLPFPHAALHHPHPADKLIIDQANLHPGQLTLVAMAPLTTLARAFDRLPDLPRLLKQVIVLGGSRNEPGNASAVAEFHFYCDPPAARQVLRSKANLMLIPLDLMRQLLFSPRELLDLPAGDAPICQLLRRIAPCGIVASEQHYGIEGFFLKDVLGIAAAALPDAFKTRPMAVDVETQGELTRGMSVFDLRLGRNPSTNADVAVEADLRQIKAYMFRIFQRFAGHST